MLSDNAKKSNLVLNCFEPGEKCYIKDFSSGLDGLEMFESLV